MYYKVAKRAAEWWVEQMKKRCKHHYPEKVICDNVDIVIVDTSLRDELSRFQEILIDEIHTNLKKSNYTCLTCSHFPSAELSGILKKANISAFYLPVHAEMEIIGTSITVSTNGNHEYKLNVS